MAMIQSFPPIINEESRILILGSIPGVKSLEAQQYYAHPYNHFWRIMYALFDKLPESDYVDRIRSLQEKRIALWDVVHQCTRNGSLDTNIVNETANDFIMLFQQHPNLILLAFNGTKAFNIYKRKVGFEGGPKAHVLLPSTSPANTRKYEDKLASWKILRDYL